MRSAHPRAQHYRMLTSTHILPFYLHLPDSSPVFDVIPINYYISPRSIPIHPDSPPPPSPRPEPRETPDPGGTEAEQRGKVLTEKKCRATGGRPCGAHRREDNDVTPTLTPGVPSGSFLPQANPSEPTAGEKSSAFFFQLGVNVGWGGRGLGRERDCSRLALAGAGEGSGGRGTVPV